MSTGIILYKSKTGTTKKYAQLLADELDYTLVETSENSLQNILDYDHIILCGGVYNSEIYGLMMFERYSRLLSNKKVAVLAVGASSNNEMIITYLKEHNLTRELSPIPLFYARGAWIEQMINTKDKLRSLFYRQSPYREDPIELNTQLNQTETTPTNRFNWFNPEYLQPLISYMKETA